jgi:hypothetical protein
MSTPTSEAGSGYVRRHPLAGWAAAVVLVGAVERLLLWLYYEPIAYGDTPSYLRLAGQISGLSFNGYDGTRTPGYPVFLAILGGDPRRVMLAQLVLGWLVSILLLWIAWHMTGSAGMAGLVALAYDLIPAMVLFEANLIAETCTTFWVVLSLALLVALMQGRRSLSSLGVAFLLGVAVSLAGLTRPLFYILPVWYLPFVYLARQDALPRRLLRVAIFSLAPIVMLGGWLLFIYRSYDMLSPTTMSGYQLVQHTGAFFEYLPEDSAGIRDTYLKYREAKIAESGVQTNAIWDAIPEMTQVSGLSFYGLSGELARLSFSLIRQHPLLYLRSVIEGWIWFWKAPAYWRPEEFPGVAQAFLRGGVLVGRAIELMANAAFLVISLSLVIWPAARRRLRPAKQALAVAGLIWLTSIVQTLADHGDNPRFLVPLQMLVFLFVAWAASSFKPSSSSNNMAAR